MAACRANAAQRAQYFEGGGVPLCKERRKVYGMPRVLHAEAKKVGSLAGAYLP